MAPPTRYLGKNSKVYANGYAIQSWLRKIKISYSADNPTDTCIGLDDQTRVQDGIISGSISYDGLLDDTVTTGGNAILHSILGDDAVNWAIMPGGDVAVGDVAHCMAGVQNEYNQEGEYSGVVMFDGASQGDGGPERCIVFHPLAARTASGVGTTVDNGAASSAGMSAYIQCTATAVPTSLIVIIQSSTTGAFSGEELTHATFTTIVAANTSERIEVAQGTGTVPRYLRAKWTIVGTSFTFFVAVHRGA